MAELTNSQKKEYAGVLYLRENLTQQEIAEKVIELAQNEKERLEMGEHAYITYKEKFDFSVFQANVLDFYKQRI